MRITVRYDNEGRKGLDDKLTGPHQKSDPYPWLADDDPWRYQSDEEIMHENIDLSNSALSRKE